MADIFTLEFTYKIAAFAANIIVPFIDKYLPKSNEVRLFH